MMNNNETAGKACTENANKFKWRSFVSMTIFVFIIILVVTGTAIQIIESLSENYETVESIPSYLTRINKEVIFALALPMFLIVIGIIVALIAF
jgi:hypothetical protein